VGQGDDLSKIAQRAYGNESFFRVIYDANKNVIGPNPNSLILGQILYIPILEGNTTPVPGQTYLVQQGDYLFLIAERAYGDGNLLNLIYEANRDVIGPDPTVLVPGQVLRIPLRP
jgi:nucleoid-associated protein YgaU